MRMLFSAAFSAASAVLFFAATGPVMAATTAEESAAQTAARLDALEQELAALKASRQASSGLASGANGNQFNPAMSLILQGTYSDYSIEPDAYALEGFYVDGESLPRPQGFSLGESELTLSANIDDQWYGQTTLALEVEDGETATSLEEAYVESTDLPAGFTLKMGRFLSGIGYLNHHHSHTDNFISRPLVYQTFLQHHLGDDGVQLRYLAPTDLYMEFGAEYLRGSAFPSEGASNSGKGIQTVYVHVGGDFGDESSWLAGASHLRGDTEAGSDGFTGELGLTIFDFTWKWSPNGNPKMGGLVLRSEWFAESRDGTFADAEPWNSSRDGGYGELMYRFPSGWQTGVRVDQVNGDGGAPAEFASANSPASTSLVLAFQHSEFSTVRLQFSQFDSVDADSGSARTEHGVSLQYLMALGAHGAHKF